MKLSIFRLTLHQKQKYRGIWFILPWLVGFLFLFFVPLINCRYSFSTLKVTIPDFHSCRTGWSNFENALFQDETYVRTLMSRCLTWSLMCR